MKKQSFDYVTRVHDAPDEIDATAWDALLQCQPHPTPFISHAYLSAMARSQSAVPTTGWTARWLSVWQGKDMVGAVAVYLKAHSYGEYVFDWAWANAYQQHGLRYYPKALVASPFTPVPGTRLLARDASARNALVVALLDWCRAEKLSSLHLLFGSSEDIAACRHSGMLLRHTVQFHWQNTDPGYADFDSFLRSMSQDKRKKVRQERRKVADAGVTFRHAEGADITARDWDFFYRCYERTYFEHGNAPYLTRDFFRAMARDMPQSWLLFVAERDGQPIACSLIAVQRGTPGNGENVAYGRYWGALERVDCLHFEACYYQPLAWCIANGFQRFEGGAQGEHKMARALLPVTTTSAHWLAHPAFADAIGQFLEREAKGIDGYVEQLRLRSPLRQTPMA